MLFSSTIVWVESSATIFKKDALSDIGFNPQELFCCPIAGESIKLNNADSMELFFNFNDYCSDAILAKLVRFGWIIFMMERILPMKN